MSKTNTDKIEEIEEKLKAQEIKDGISSGIQKWIRTVCITATCSVLSFFGWLGNYVYTHSEAVYLAAEAFIIALRHGK